MITADKSGMTRIVSFKGRKPRRGRRGEQEWEILGQSSQEVYVWAICQITDLEIGSAGSAPAVITLGNDGSIEKVQIPRDGTQYGIDIREIFPSELQEQITRHAVSMDAMWSHIQSRHQNPEPPLIVLSGVPLP